GAARCGRGLERIREAVVEAILEARPGRACVDTAEYATAAPDQQRARRRAIRHDDRRVATFGPGRGPYAGAGPGRSGAGQQADGDRSCKLHWSLPLPRYRQLRDKRVDPVTRGRLPCFTAYDAVGGQGQDALTTRRPRHGVRVKPGPRMLYPEGPGRRIRARVCARAGFGAAALLRKRAC